MQGAQGYSGSTLGLELPKILGDGLGIHLQREEPWTGKLLEGVRGKSQPFCAVFHPPHFAPKNALLAGGQQEGDVWWEPGMAGGGSGQEFGAGPPAVAAFLALHALPSPGLRTAGSRTSPRRLGHWPLFRRIKLALLLSLSLFQQFLPPLSLGSGGNIPAWGLPRKIPTGGTRRDGDWQHHGGRGWPWDRGSPGMGIAPRLRVGAHFASRKSPFPAWDTGNSSHQRDGWLVVPWVTKEQPEDMGTRCVTSGVSQR